VFRDYEETCIWVEIKSTENRVSENLDKTVVSAGVLLFLAGLVGVFYGVGVNLQGMMARGATDYSFITAYITEWTLILVAGLVLIVAGARKK
jgi:hypothetical protein